MSLDQSGPKLVSVCVCKGVVGDLYTIGLPVVMLLPVFYVFSPLAATLSDATPFSLSALQQEALYISRSALSGLEPIGEGVLFTDDNEVIFWQILLALQYRVGKHTHSHCSLLNCSQVSLAKCTRQI